MSALDVIVGCPTVGRNHFEREAAKESVVRPKWALRRLGPGTLRRQRLNDHAARQACGTGACGHARVKTNKRPLCEATVFNRSS